MRIVSLLPSATEIVCALGLRTDLVGVTHECDFPADVADLPTVTRTHIPVDADSATIDGLVRGELDQRGALYSLDLEQLAAVRPDLIVSQTLCDVCAVADNEVRDACRQLDPAPRVVYLEPTRLADVYDNIATVAAAAGVPERARQVIDQLAARVTLVGQRRPPTPQRIVVLEWLDPPFSSGHWTPELVELAGGTEPLARAGARSRQIAWDELVAADPDILLVACCGFSIDRTRQELPAFLARPAVAGLRCVRAGRVHLTDGAAYFSRPGPRLIDSLELLAELIAPSPQRPAHLRDALATV